MKINLPILLTGFKPGRSGRRYTPGVYPTARRKKRPDPQKTLDRVLARGPEIASPCSSLSCALPAANRATNARLKEKLIERPIGLRIELESPGESAPLAPASSRTIEPHMQLASGSHIPDGLLAANALLSEKLHQGFAAPKSTLHQGFGVAISSTPLGIISPLYDDGTGSRYTGKERDTESGNDYFGARYYNSATGRFLSPDWSAKEEPVPYAKLDNPQSLNLYSYVLNNPLSHVDPDGHETEEEKEKKIAEAARAQKGSDAYDQKKTNISNMQIFHSGSDKCNEFVSDTVKSATGTRPVVEATGKIATAAQMADPNVKIVGLSAPEPMSNAKPGDVVAQIHGTEPNGNVDAHVGIIVGLPTANSQGANCFGRRLRGRANRG